MRLYTRTRLVLSCIIPCYLIVGFFVFSFLAMWKSEIESDLQTRATLVADELGLLLARTRPEEVEGQLEERVASHHWLQKVSILDAYGRVIASDGSPLGREGILAHNVARRRQILKASESLFFPESCEFFKPYTIGSRSYIIRVGLTPGSLRRRVWWAVRWFLPGWLIAALMTLLAALYLSRVTLERLVSSMANQVNRVADGKSADPLPVREPAFEPLADGLRRLFRSIDADRSRMGHLERNISETRDRASHGRHELERLVHEKERLLSLFREESRLLWERCGCGILRLDPDLQIQAANSAARQWLSLGPSPDSADLPHGLCRILKSANTSPGPSPSYGTFVARHPFFGQERQIDATCIPLGPAEAPRGKPMLILLEEHASPKANVTDEAQPLEGFLRLLKGTLISIGQEFHTLGGSRKASERSQKTRQAVIRLAKAVRDIETLISFHRADELLHGRPPASCRWSQVSAAVTQAARYLGVSAELEIEPNLQAQSSMLDHVTLPIGSQLLDMALRESLAVVGDLNSSTCLVLSAGIRREKLELTVSAREAGEERGLFGHTLSEYLQKGGELHKSGDLIRLRVALLQKILEQTDGGLDVSPDRRGLTLSVPFNAAAGLPSAPAHPHSLARAFLS